VSEDIGAQLVLGDRPIEITVCSLLAEQWFILNGILVFVQ